MKFKVGDTVKIIDTVKCYDIYKDMFKRMGFKNPKERKYPIRYMDIEYKIFAIENHNYKTDVLLYGIEDADDNQYLFGEDGLELVKKEKESKPKNIELLKDMPTFISELGDIIKRTKGFVYGWNPDKDRWESEINAKAVTYVTKDCLKANPTWYKETRKKPTIPPKIYVGGEEVKFLDDGIKIGCVEISKADCKEIYSRLKKQS